ncbi:CheW domain-containing protein [Polyangium sp. y55x31]|uniref:chemotaxis protein CheW n=1 Tax=Polyangium sp. y55x31 TaxID=3042688 RepID=UPI00248245E5|nr:CheW domain-containing protein [Polyangium sp. y55x31]MDI1479453.1 CheW domain-containing protein [Polyangium sp. y55x31]
MEEPTGRRTFLLVRARSWMCALPASSVVETMRPLSIDPVTNAPRFVVGLSVVRGEVVPVVSLSAVLGGSEQTEARRLVLVRAGERRLGLLVEDVLGVEELDEKRLEALPPLLGAALPAEVERLGSLDGQALAVLDAARLLPADAFASLPGAASLSAADAR